jgi:hypothetical protein
MYLVTYFIYGYSVGSDHFPVHLELHIGSGEGEKVAYKGNVSYLKDKIFYKMEDVNLFIQN